MKKNSELYRGFLFVALVIFLLSACGGISSKKVVTKEKSYKYASMKDGVLHLDIDKSRRDSSILNLSDICDSLIYIPLETRDDCLLGKQLNAFHLDGDDVFLNVGWGVYHFKTDGRFVCQIGKIGRGPGECVCTGLCINKELKRVYVRANYKLKLLEYDYDGSLVSERISLPDKQADMLYLPATKSMFYTSNFILTKREGSRPEYISLSEYDLSGVLRYKRLSKYFPDKFFVGGRGARMLVSGSSKYAFDASLFFQEIASDTVFMKEGESIRPHIILNNKDFKKDFTSDNVAFMRDMSSSHCVYDYSPSSVCGESSRFVFVDCSSEPAYVYDKIEKELKCVKRYIEYDDDTEKPMRYVYFNDLDGLNHLDHTRLLDNKYLYSYVSAIDLLDNLDRLKGSKTVSNMYIKQLEKLCEGLTEESNPVLVLARLKK